MSQHVHEYLGNYVSANATPSHDFPHVNFLRIEVLDQYGDKV